MAGRIVARGGFGGAALADASESLRARVAADDARHEFQAAVEAAERRERAEIFQERSIAASVAMAESQGAVLSMRERIAGVGRTPREAIEFFSAVADVEDAREEARRARRFQAFEQRLSDAASADVSAPSEVDVSEFQEMQSRAADFRRKVADELRVRAAAVAEARRLASVDRRAVEQRRWGV